MGNRIDMVVDANALEYEYHRGTGFVMILVDALTFSNILRSYSKIVYKKKSLTRSSIDLVACDIVSTIVSINCSTRVICSCLSLLFVNGSPFN